MFDNHLEVPLEPPMQEPLVDGDMLYKQASGFGKWDANLVVAYLRIEVLGEGGRGGANCSQKDHFRELFFSFISNIFQMRQNHFVLDLESIS